MNHREIALHSSFFKFVKDIWEKSVENNGDEIAVLFLEGHEAIQITYQPWGVSFKRRVAICVWIISCLKGGIMIYDFLKFFISNLDMIFSLSGHGRKH